MVAISITPSIIWEALPPDYVLPDDPVENIQQPLLAAALTDALKDYIKPEMLIVSNFGLVATVNKKIIVKAPDWLYVPQVYPVAGVIRHSYTQNLQGSPVGIVMEFLSDTDGGELSMRSTPPFGKFYFYEQILQVPTYVTYDPYESILEVRCLEKGSKYILQTADNQGRFWIEQLQLFLGIWQGERLGNNIPWLRWWDVSGNMLLWGFEQAELESQRATLEYQRAEQEYQRAEQEYQRAELLAAKLRELGIDPSEI